MSSNDPIQVFHRKRLTQRRARAASSYKTVSFLKKRVGEDILDRVSLTNRHFPLALDLGAGSNGSENGLSSVTGTIVSTDPSIKFLSGQKGAVCCDEELLPFHPHSFDLVVSGLALHWVNDLLGTLIQIRHVLKPDGYFVASMIGGETLKELRQILLQAESELLGGATMRVSPFADVSDLSSLLQRAGFAMPVSDRERLTIRYDNMFALLQDLKASGETHSPVNLERQPLSPRILMRAAELYAEQFSDPDGRIRVSVEILWMTGWAPHESQPMPKRRGSATHRLADAVGAIELSAGEKTPK